MSAVTRTLATEQGATCEFTVTWLVGEEDPDNAGEYLPGDPYDLTGCTARMQIRSKVTDTEPLVRATTENNMIQLGADQGTVNVLIPAEETDKIITKRAVYDIEVEFPDGRVVRLMQGPINNSLSVTRD